MSTPNARVVEYYEKGLIDYFLIYFRSGNYSMNYGYWDQTVRSRNQALFRLYEKINEFLQLHFDAVLLDAGCGFGEASCWFARKTGCNATGITIVSSQAVSATQLAKKRGLSQKVVFEVMDYTKTSFNVGSFDAIVAIETICHLADRTDFYKEAFRILKPGGKLVVCEYTRRREPGSKVETKEMNIFEQGWKMAPLWSDAEHQNAMKRVGFSNIIAEDYSDRTIMVSKFLYAYSIFGIPIYTTLRKIGLINDIRMDNAKACKYQWIAKKKHLWGHTMFKAIKN